MPVTVECERCNIGYSVKPSRVEKTRFCSRKCKDEWQKEGLKGKNNPFWQGGKVRKECEICDKKYAIKPAREDISRFCSNKCRAKWMSEERSGKNFWRYNSVEVQCEQCDKKLIRCPSKLERQDNVFCSRKCLGKWLSENQCGENNPRWNGGRLPYYGRNWQRMRRKARERDNYCCRVCNIGEEDLERQLDVHHITPIREFDEPEDANTLSNLVSVCRSCHNTIEGWRMIPEVCA